MPSILKFVEESEQLKKGSIQNLVTETEKKKAQLSPFAIRPFEPPPLEQQDIINLLNWTAPKPPVHPEIRSQLPSDLGKPTLEESPAERYAAQLAFSTTPTPEQLQAIKEELGTAFITEAEQPTLGGAFKGSLVGLKNLVTGIISPENLALMAAFGSAGPLTKRLASTAFGAHMLSQLPAQQMEYQDALAKGRYADATRIAIEEIGTFLFGTGALKHGVYSPPKLEPKITSEDLKLFEPPPPSPSPIQTIVNPETGTIESVVTNPQLFQQAITEAVEKIRPVVETIKPSEIETPKKKKTIPKLKKPLGAVQFLRSLGGINPDLAESSDIRELGRFDLLNKKMGKSLDNATLLFIEDDRLPPGSTGTDLINLLDTEIKTGKKQLSFSDAHEIIPEEKPIEFYTEDELDLGIASLRRKLMTTAEENANLEEMVGRKKSDMEFWAQQAAQFSKDLDDLVNNPVKSEYPSPLTETGKKIEESKINLSLVQRALTLIRTDRPEEAERLIKAETGKTFREYLQEFKPKELQEQFQLPEIPKPIMPETPLKPLVEQAEPSKLLETFTPKYKDRQLFFGSEEAGAVRIGDLLQDEITGFEPVNEARLDLSKELTRLGNKEMGQGIINALGTAIWSNIVKLFGIRRERLIVGFGPNIGTKIANIMRLNMFEQAVATKMLSKDVLYRFKGISKNADIAVFDAAKVVEGLDEKGDFILGTKLRIGTTETSYPQGTIFSNNILIGEPIELLLEQKKALEGTLTEQIPKPIEPPIQPIGVQQPLPIEPTPTVGKPTLRQVYKIVTPDEARQVMTDFQKNYPEAMSILKEYVEKREKYKTLTMQLVQERSFELPPFSRVEMAEKFLTEGKGLSGYVHSFEEDPKNFFQFLKSLKNMIRYADVPEFQYKTGYLAGRGLAPLKYLKDPATVAEHFKEIEKPVSIQEFLSKTSEVRSLSKASIKSRTEIALGKLHNQVGEDIEKLITIPLVEGKEPKPGFIVYKGQFGDLKDQRLQITKFAAKEFGRLFNIEFKDETGNRLIDLTQRYLSDAVSTIVDSIRGTLLLNPGIMVTNWIGQELQYLPKVLENFYKGVLGGGFTEFLQDIKAIPVSYTGRTGISKEITGQTLLEYERLLKPKGLYSRTVEKILENSFSIPDVLTKKRILFSSLRSQAIRIADKLVQQGKLTPGTYDRFIEYLIRVPTKKIFDKAQDEKTIFGFGYEEGPEFIDKIHRSLLGRSFLPFISWIYFYARLQLREVNPANLKALFRNMPIDERRERLARILTGSTLLGGSLALLSQANVGKDKTNEGREYPAALETQGRLESKLAMEWLDTHFGTEFQKEGKSLYFRIIKYPWIREAMLLKGLSSNGIGIMDFVKESISTGPLFQIAANIEGLNSIYQRGVPITASIGKTLGDIKPFAPYFTHLRKNADEYKRKGYVQGASALTNLLAGFVETMPYLSRLLEPRIGTDGAALKYDPVIESLKFWLGFNFKTIDERDLLAFELTTRTKESTIGLTEQELERRVRSEKSQKIRNFVDYLEDTNMSDDMKVHMLDFVKNNIAKNQSQMLSDFRKMAKIMKDDPKQRDLLNEIAERYIGAMEPGADGEDIRKIMPPDWSPFLSERKTFR